MEDSGGGLLPAVEGHSLEQNSLWLTVVLGHLGRWFESHSPVKW